MPWQDSGEPIRELLQIFAAVVIAFGKACLHRAKNGKTLPKRRNLRRHEPRSTGDTVLDGPASPTTPWSVNRGEIAMTSRSLLAGFLMTGLLLSCSRLIAAESTPLAKVPANLDEINAMQKKGQE